MNKIKQLAQLISVTMSLLFVITFPNTSNADVGKYSEISSINNRGEEIIREMTRRDSGFENLSANVTMTLTNIHGDSAVRRLTLKTLEGEYGKDGNMNLAVFRSPSDVKGTKFLSHSHLHKPDERWLYLPALNRIKGLSSGDISGSFMGSEFSYEDIGSQQVGKHTYKFLSEDSSNGLACFVVQRISINPASGYSKSVVWIDTLEYRLQRIDFYDKKESLLKTYTALDYFQYQSKRWRARVMKMINHQTGRSARLVWTDIIFGSDLRASDFHPRALKRASR